MIKKILSNLFLKKNDNEITRNVKIKSRLEYCAYRFRDEEMKKCYEHFKKHFYSSVFIEGDKKNRHNIWNFALENCELKENELIAEFGVYKGESLKFFSKNINNRKIFGFDSFEGLPENWVGSTFKKNSFKVNEIPKFSSNVEIIRGLVQDTLENFLKKNEKKKFSLINLDLDLYSSTKYVLNKIKPFCRSGTIIIFDDLYNHSGWSVGEYKALQETLSNDDYDFIAFGTRNSQAVIKIK